MELNRFFFQRWHTNCHQVCKILVSINVLCLVTQLYLTRCDPMDCSPPGLGCRALLQGIFPTQESNPGLSHCGWILYYLNYQGSPRILEWVAYPFSRGSSPPRNRTQVSCIACRFFTNWAIRGALLKGKGVSKEKAE